MTTEKQPKNNKKLVLFNKTKALCKKSEIEELREIFVNPPYNIKEEELLEEYVKLRKVKNKTQKQESRGRELIEEIVVFHGLDNGVLLQSITNDKKFQQGLAIIRGNLIDEYQCTTPSELILVDKIITGYWRTMRYEMYINRLIEKEPNSFSFDQLKVNILKEFHKGIEFANRQSIAALITLRQIKSPPLNINVKTKTAFVAQNQQLNVNSPNKDENIEPK